MKYKLLVLASVVVLSILSAAAQPRIAVLDFSAGVNVNQSDVDGLSAIFNTYFEPQGYTVVERTRVNRILEEHKIQSGKITETDMARLGEILNVPVIVIGDVNLAMKQYNIDIRVVNVETGAIIAKDGAEWAEGTSYRETMRKIAERMSSKIPLVDFYRPPAPEPTPKPEPKVADPRYRPTGSYLRFGLGAVNIIASIAYNYQITPSFMVGAGVGVGDEEEHFTATLPIYAEVELRTPRYDWSLFINTKIGCNAISDYGIIFFNVSAGFGYKNLNLGIGYFYIDEESFPSVFLSYSDTIQKSV